jgi:uncharacterized protein YllA (UPF0747 family)
MFAGARTAGNIATGDLPNAARRLEGPDQVAHLRTKFVHAQARHNDIVTKQIEKALSILYPQKSLQERRLSIFYFLSRYGTDFLAQLYEEIDLSDQDHRLLHV